MTSGERDPALFRLEGEALPFELQEPDRRVVAWFTHELGPFFEAGGLWEGEPPSVVQLEGYDEADEAVRDTIIFQISSALGMDVDNDMNLAETQWRSTDCEPTLTVEPWMKKRLGMNDPDTALTISGENGAYRRALLFVDEGMEYWLEELEIPNRVTEADGTVRSRVNRVLFYSANPFVA